MHSRSCLTTVKALSKEPSMSPKGVVMLSDSMCSIAAVETKSRSLKPFFHNRVAEIINNMEEMKQYCPVEKIFHIPGNLNPADLATRGKAHLSDLGPGSFWQTGPSFFRLRRDKWPVTRNVDLLEVPPDEVRYKLGSSLIAEVMLAKTSADSSHLWPKLWHTIRGILEYSNSLLKITGIIVRLIKAWRLKHQALPSC